MVTESSSQESSISGSLFLHRLLLHFQFHQFWGLSFCLVEFQSISDWFFFLQLYSGVLARNERRNWAASPSDVLYHFGTSGLSVAVATAVTHPLGSLFFPFKFWIMPSRFLFLWFRNYIPHVSDGYFVVRWAIKCISFL